MKRLVATLVSLAAVAAACQGDAGNSGPTGLIPRGLASCGSNVELFSRTPVDPAMIMGWVPLGIMSPPGHALPTDHQYIYLTTFGSSADATPLVAPGRITVIGARRSTHSTGSTGADYSLDFMPCADVMADFSHVTSIAPSLLSQLGPFDQRCNTYSPNPGLEVQQCYTRNIGVVVEAGEPLGTTRGLDLTLFDRRVAPIVFANPARWSVNDPAFDRYHIVPFSAYYAEPARSAVRAMLGSFDGRTHRDIEPLGGSLASDVPGTAQGAWFNPSQPTFPETAHLAITPEYLDPRRIAVSIGLSQPGMTPGAYLFTPVATGLVNRAPSTITPGETIYCWEIGYGPTEMRGIVLVQLVDAMTLRMEARPGFEVSCAGQSPFVFTENVFRYVR